MFLSSVPLPPPQCRVLHTAPCRSASAHHRCCSFCLILSPGTLVVSLRHFILLSCFMLKLVYLLAPLPQMDTKEKHKGSVEFGWSDFTTSTNQSIPDLAITSYPGLNAANRFTDFLTNFLPPHSAVGHAYIGGTRILEATWQTCSFFERKEKKLQPSSSLQPSSEIFSHLEPTERNDTLRASSNPTNAAEKAR
ncbi:hypothetical protein DFH08DRAFT_814752 [Mycena albidolilacea]|uniref:Uncharacterized protein n=1 Tax=Mycena albidolilacea TaxID=1033008 RepID=A0AAD6ZPM0_9AGAR|nr:hypothetical protein DFH08DRAFT_814752 [Mycena albidolilacea]